MLIYFYNVWSIFRWWNKVHITVTTYSALILHPNPATFSILYIFKVPNALFTLPILHKLWRFKDTGLTVFSSLYTWEAMHV